MRRLFHCLKEHEKDLGVEVVNISQCGQTWEKWLRTILHQSSLPVNCTAFMGMTDIVLLGRNGFVNVIVTEDEMTCLVELVSAVSVVEIGLGLPR